MFRFRLISAVAAKEVRELVRDPVTLGIALALPLALLFIFGYALNLDVRDMPAVVVDLDASPESRAYADQLDRTAEFRITARLVDLRAVPEALDRGEAHLAVVIPAGFGAAVRGRQVAQVQTLVDGTFSATAQVIAGYLETMNTAFGGAQGWAHSTGPAASPVIQTRVWYNPALTSVISIVPGLFGVVLMAFPPLLTALAVVRDKERGSLQQILISPLRPWLFVLGKLTPYAVLAFLDMLLIVGAGMWWFGVPLKGSFALLAGAAVLYVLATLGIGLFVSTVTRTQVVALLLVLVLTVMPSFMFSGFLFPIFTMPTALQYYTYLFPGRYFVDLSRGIFLKGVGADVLAFDLVLLALYAAGMIAVASVRLKRQTG